MSPGGQLGANLGRRLSYPFLMVCDRSGSVLWMSDDARALFGESVSLLGTVPVWRSSEDAQGAPIELVYSRLLEMGRTVLVGARLAKPGEVQAEPKDGVLTLLQGKLLLHYFRLLKVERRLARRAGQSRPGSGLRALRQIELERERLGRELHTSVGQPLSAIRLQAEVIASQLPEGSGPMQEALDRIFALTADALEQVRSISKSLHPPEWQRLSLTDALEQLWALSGIPQRFESSFHFIPLSREPSLEAKTLLYRAAQEAVSNLIRHSQASKVEASLQEQSGQIILSFRDNGVGFDQSRMFSAPPKVSDGIGLRSIRDQAESFGGKLVLDSGPEGTKLEIMVPFAPPEA